MNKSQVIAILFDDNPEKIFCAGQLVTGHVHVEILERIKIRGIRLEVTVKAETSWTEGHGETTTTYTAKEEYMNLEINFVGSLCPAPRTRQALRRSATGRDSSIHDQLVKASPLVDQTHFKFVDVSYSGSEPQVIHSEAPASGCCCVAGFAEINATINRGCFVLGETICIDGVIANRTNINVKYSTVSLMQKIEYLAKKKSGKVYHRTQKLTTLAKCERPSIPRGHTDSWSNISFVVPQVLASRLDGCSIINIKHYIEISATFYTRCSNSTASSEIVIGNIPLRNDVQPSVVTSQPTGFPMSYHMSVGYMPPTSVQIIGFDNLAEDKTLNHGSKELTQVHTS